MRHLLPAASVIVLLGCGDSHRVTALDGGALADASFDAPLDAAEALDAFVPLPTPDDAHDCGAWATFTCARYADCYSTLLWFHGSFQRCEDVLRVECEHEESLEDTGDLATARIACAREFADGCDWATDMALCPRPSGTREIGAPCRSDLQCGEGETSDGRAVPLRCFRDTEHEPACDSGTCQLPLGEGADCNGVIATIDHDRCEPGLVCRDDSRDSWCVPIASTLGSLGQPCNPAASFPDCESDLVCGPTSTCELQPTNGQPCDPDIRDHCGGLLSRVSQYCDATSRTCHPLLQALDGEPCDADPNGPLCGLSSRCVDGTCVPAPQYRARGEACTAESDCRSFFACVDGLCAPAPCD